MGISEKSNQLYGVTFKALGLTAGVIFFWQFLNLLSFLFVIKGSLVCLITSSAKLPNVVTLSSLY